MNRTLTKQRQCSHVAPSIVPLFGNPHHQLKLFVQRVICVWRDSDLKTNYTVNLHLVSVGTIRESAQIRWNIRLIPMHLDKCNYPHRNHTRSTTFWVVEIEEKQRVSGSGRKRRRWQRIRLNVTLPKNGGEGGPASAQQTALTASRSGWVSSPPQDIRKNWSSVIWKSRIKRLFYLRQSIVWPVERPANNLAFINKPRSFPMTLNIR